MSQLTFVGNGLSYSDTTVAIQTIYYYAVSAVTAAGEGPLSNEVQITVTDSTSPTILITAPADGSTSSSTAVTVSGTASDNVALETVEISLDEVTWLPASGTTSWSGSFTLEEGENTITARASDTSGNTDTDSVLVTVTIETGVGPDPCEASLSVGCFTIGVLVSLAAAAAAIAIAVLVLRNRRRRGA